MREKDREANMSYRIERRIYWLYETVEMLGKYVNGVTFQSIRDKMVSLYGADLPQKFLSHMDCLDQISKEVCEDLNLQDAQVQRYFRYFDGDGVRDRLCLAKVMTHSFFLYQDEDASKECVNLKAHWHWLREQGFSLGEMSGAGLAFRALEAGQQPRDLVSQFYSLDYPVECRMELLQMMTHYDTYLDTLLEMILPYVHRLQERFVMLPQIMEETADYWERQIMDQAPSLLVEMITQASEIPENMVCNRVLFSIMGSAAVLYDLKGELSLQYHGGTTYVIGCGVTASNTAKKVSGTMERTCAIMRSICDKNKFEVLRRLSVERSYGQKLSEEMGVNPGHMSRILIALFGYGFLIREQEQSKYYYSTDKENLARFFDQAKELFVGKDSKP